MEESVLRIEVTDVVEVHDFVCVRTRNELVPSPFFQPEFTFTMEDDGEGVNGSPRGPCVTIDFGLAETPFV